MGWDSLVSGVKEATTVANQVTNTSQKVGRVANRAGNLVGVRTSGQPNRQNNNILSETTEIIAPEGTCVIIPKEVTANKQFRYLGRNAYESLVNMANLREGCDNVVVLDATGQPSAAVYDRTATGYVLKGTQIPVKIEVENGGYKGVALSETEFAVCVKAIQTQDPNQEKFKTTSEMGKAEDANAAGWFKRNWEWLTGAIVTAAVAIGACFLFKKQRKKTKDAQKKVSELKTQVTKLETDIAELSTEKSGESTLAQNGTLVKDTAVLSSDSAINTGNSGRV
ncbi:MAG: hypothetical protein IJC11_01090 [Alphaproteobacteria bacterium]|nr:hypothetical protein [Alphaproteobacteria bacterium]